jgi:phosphatidylglycerophosphate synthase
MKKKMTISDYLSLLRCLGAVSLLFIQPFVTAFYMIYLLCGLTDVLDGWIARKTKSTSEFGARLDSIADLLFYGALFWKLIPVLRMELSGMIWCAAGIILFLRLGIYLAVAMRWHCLASRHTYLNKATGLLIFALPFVMRTPWKGIYYVIVAVVAGTAAVEELIYYINKRK